MVYKNYYKILGLETNHVSIEDIKNAYRQAAKKYHPDLNIGDSLAEEKIKDINEAYKVLSVPASKRKYDRIWNSRFAKKKKAFSGRAKKGAILNMFIGKVDLPNDNDKISRSKMQPIKGEDIETQINATVEEAFYGAEKKISLRTIDGKTKVISVKIPEGILDGEKIRLIGQGKHGENGGKNGDLFLRINIEKNSRFKLEGYDLYTDLYLSPWEAALGTRANIETIDDETKVYIPKGIQSGEKIRIPGKGYKTGSGSRGDLVAEVKVMVPKQLSKEEKEMFEKLNEISNFNPRSIKK